jgi:Flp pilus assembly protein TadB
LNKKQIEIQKERNKTLYVFVIVVVVALLVCAFFINKLNKSNKEKAKAHDLISEQKEELLQKQKEITSSIQYAKRIQEALLPNQRYIKKHLDKNS